MMATEIIDGVESKKCTICKKWKPCSEFPKNAKSHGKSQCYTHCQCKECKGK